MSILFDTNIVLDVLLDREPFALHSAQTLALVEQGQIRGYLCATTITTLFYLCKRAQTAQHAKQSIDTLLKLFDIAPVNRTVLSHAIETGFADFEDAVLHEAARLTGCHGIITRNVRDFACASLPIYTPEEFLGIWTNGPRT
ncbi:Predicted nucleic acid-binding protein, contains PIN domain [Lampropedia hyalina DSM 16112]|jgi:predicted nucleic acid-binding protein|uniref:Predicted nucleic acid-binding protein, contains PIN domain n=1 Tax=Lampropedia hyalina DSM 16112 TaxID=1122156 RepID=A0A1M4W059_9BURK|nr:PIN domain-containing protein [Lampropedia hyalina]SHE74684.1 Predicted nucleic acid-binding protein, contains PIN domain [Lampropedia hyalina DSM 16112]